MMTRSRLQSYIITLICFLFSAYSINWNGKYYKAQGNVSLESVYSVKAQNLIECAARCLSRKCSCYSFDKELRLCEVGDCTVGDSTTDTSKQLYVSCDPNEGYRLLTYSSITACIWVSSIRVNYTDARAQCTAMASRLYTLKTVDKLAMLQKTFGFANFWIGLDDIETEGTFRWVDDNTACGPELTKELFYPGRPDDYRNNQDCARYLGTKLDDDYCYSTFKYICEKTFFNVF